MDDQRDYAEEAAVLADLVREGEEELAAERAEHAEYQGRHRAAEPETATPGVCANQMYSSIGGRCCAHCGQQIHHDGNGWRHIATKQAACAMAAGKGGGER